MKTFKSICIYEGEKVKQFTIADSEKEARNILKQAGFKVKKIEIIKAEPIELKGKLK